MNWKRFKWGKIITTAIAVVGVYTFISQYLQYVPPVPTPDFEYNNGYGNEYGVDDIGY